MECSDIYVISQIVQLIGWIVVTACMIVIARRG